jgi:hypothetical protein
MLRRVMTGAAAGAAGTTALNAVTYADMGWRARPASSAPEEALDRVASRAGRPIPGEGQERSNRRSGLAGLTGIGLGVAVGTAYGLLAPRALSRHWVGVGVVLGALAMAGADVPLVRLGVTDPRKWSAADWASDVVPHLAYGLVTSWTVARAVAR